MDRYFHNSAAADEVPSVRSEAWYFAQAILGKPIPCPFAAEAEARRKRQQLEWLAGISERHADELRRVQSAEAEARRQREELEWAASISTRAEGQLRAMQRKEADEREASRRSQQFDEAYAASVTEWDEVDHPRAPKGTPTGGQWVDKGGGGGQSMVGGAPPPSEQLAPAEAPVGIAPPPVTRSHLPAAHRGTWVDGTKGHGVFRYNQSLENQEVGLAGKEVRFENQHIAVGGFPPESYYGGSAASATVTIANVTGTRTDNVAADLAMRERLKNPKWQRPDGFRWNHAGGPNSKAMELVNVGVHRRVAHKGSAALPRAQARVAAGRGASGRAMGALTVYLATRDILRAGGVLKPDRYVDAGETYHFRSNDGSVFIVHASGFFSNAEREYVEGPRKGQRATITDAEVELLRKQAEEEFGKYIPGTLFTDPRFVPGKQRATLPLILYNKYGVPHDAGWIDEKGVHYYDVPKELPI